MMKQKLLKIVSLLLAACCLVLLAACGSETPAETTVQAPSLTTSAEAGKTETTAASATTEETTSVSSDPAGSVIAKLTGAADDVGIYAIVITLSENIAEKGTVEMIYHGAKGTPQETSIVNTFRIEYEKEAAGTFEIRTFFDGEVYQNQHHADKVKVNNTFSATLRAGDVVITYTPDGGEPTEIYRATAEQFR